MNKISFKISLLFFISVFILLIISLLFLHEKIVDQIITSELENLLQRGYSHRDVLETTMDDTTIQHIVLMESNTDTKILITDKEKREIASSSIPKNEKQKILLSDIQSIEIKGKYIEENWKDNPFISVVIPFASNGMNAQQEGYIFMLKSTEKVQMLIKELNRHFLIATALTIAMLLISFIFLSRFLTKPLILMKNATKHLSQGDFSVELPKIKSKDELGELSSAIKILAADLNRLKENRSEFLANISHELRTPLTFIKGYSEIMLKRKLSEKENTYYLSIIQEESEKLTGLIKELFELAKLDQHEFPIQLEKVPLLEFLKHICNKVQPAFHNKNISMEIHCPPNLYALIDPIRFEQILLNLLDNARKYSNKDGKVTLSAYEYDEAINLTIRDEGVGIPLEDQPYIFERFFRVDKSRNRENGGAGLGLSIVKQLIEAQGGKISVQSELGKGSVFEIVLKGEK